MNPKMVRCVLGAWILGMCLAISLPVHAQVAGATLSGTITDAKGAAVPNAKIAVKNVATDTTVEGAANGSGFYTVPNLNPGDYEISVTAQGFSTAALKVTLTVGQKQELNVPLAVGQLEQIVQVTTEAPQVELTSSEVSGNVSGVVVRELPLNGRDWASLATLEPGVVEARTHLDVTHVGGGGGRGFGDQLSVSGSRPTQNSYRLDGALVNDYSNAGPGSVLGKNLGVDAIQEFTVLSSNYSAEYGFTSGGVINAITKSGTNSFHGSGFDFLRNDALDAANFFTNAKGLQKNFLRQNQFGASAGYKILKDKLFLFGAYEGVRKSAGLPVTGNETISDAVRAGHIINESTGAAVTVSSIDPNVAKFLALYPHPAAGSVGCVALPSTQFSAPGVHGGCDPNVGFFPFVGTQKANENFVTARADYKISDKDSLFGTYLRDSSDFLSPLTFNNELQLFTSYRQAGVLEATHVFSPTLVNTVRVAIDRTNNLGGNSPTAINPAAGDATLGMLPGFFSPGVTLTNTGVTALPGGVGGGASIQDFWGQIFQLYDDAFITRGSHSIKFGFAFLDYHVDGYTPLAGFNGSGTWNATGTLLTANATPTPTAAEGNVGAGTNCYNTGAVSSGNSYDASCGALVNFLTNQPSAAARPFASQSPDIVNKHYLRDKVFSGYIQDDWKIRRNLTLNLGLRYEIATIPTEKYGEVAIVPSPTTIFPCGSPIPTDTCTGTSSSPSSKAVLLAGKTQAQGDPTTVLRNSYWTNNPTTKNFEPRVGFAWDPFGNGKTSVRAGFGMFDALPLPYELILNSTSSAPWRSTLQGLGNSVNASPAQGIWPFGVPALTNVHITAASTRTFMYVDNNIKRNYVYQYNLNVQRQLASGLTVLVGYTGSRGVHNPFQSDTVNTIIPTFAPGVGYYWPGFSGGTAGTAGTSDWMNSSNTDLVTHFCNGVAGVPTSGTQACKAADVVNSRRLNPSTGGMFNTMYQSSSWYNAMEIKVQERMIHGISVQGSFTWSKSIDDSSGSTAGDTFQLDAVSQPWYDLRLNKGLSDFDVRKNLTINGSYTPPTPKMLGAFGTKVLGGWQLGMIAHFGDGVPIPLFLGQDIAGEGTTTVNPPTLLNGCTSQSMIDPNYRHDLSYINGFAGSSGTACLGFTPLTAANASVCDVWTASNPRGAPTGAAVNSCPNIRGNLGRDVLVGPGLWTMDFSFFKNNYVPKISEAFNVQLRAEMFNAFNHTNFAPTSNNSMLSNTKGVISSTFGQLTATQGDNRVIQLAVKVLW